MSKQACGISAPFTKIYITSDPCERLPMLLFLCTAYLAPRLTFDPDFGTLVRANKKDVVDGAPFAAGIVTFLKQFHGDYMNRYLGYVGQYVRTSTIEAFKNKGSTAVKLSDEAFNMLVLLEQASGG